MTTKSEIDPVNPYLKSYPYLSDPQKILLTSSVLQKEAKQANNLKDAYEQTDFFDSLEEEKNWTGMKSYLTHSTKKPQQEGILEDLYNDLVRISTYLKAEIEKRKCPS